MIQLADFDTGLGAPSKTQPIAQMAIDPQPSRRRPRTVMGAIRLEEPTKAYYRLGRKGAFHDFSPLAFVQRLQNEYDSDDLGLNFAQAMLKHPSVKSPRDLLIRTPRGVAFRPIVEVATSEHYFLMTWTIVDRVTVPFFEEYCRISSRKLGFYNRETKTIDGLPLVDLKKCRLTWPEELERRYPRPVDPDIDVLQMAKEMLRKRTPAQLHVWEQRYGPNENPVRHLQRLRKSCIKKAKLIETELTEYFGEATDATPQVCQRIPLEGILQGRIWTFSTHILYLTVDQLERELPCYIVLGTVLRTPRK